MFTEIWLEEFSHVAEQSVITVALVVKGVELQINGNPLGMNVACFIAFLEKLRTVNPGVFLLYLFD